MTEHAAKQALAKKVGAGETATQFSQAGRVFVLSSLYIPTMLDTIAVVSPSVDGARSILTDRRLK
jgi:hypothetical protein